MSVPALVADQWFFVPMDEEITVARAQLAIASSPSERFAFAALIQNLRQFQLSALEQLLDKTSQDDPGFDAFIDWSPEWSAEAQADLRELEGVKEEAMRSLSQEEADAALANAESDFTRLQDRIRDVPGFVEVAERFEEHRRAANPEDE